jgi:hypothetical protein
MEGAPTPATTGGLAELRACGDLNSPGLASPIVSQTSVRRLQAKLITEAGLI